MSSASSSSKIVLCTGANQGLGFCILQVAGLRKSEYTYILCSRDIIAGKEAVQKLKDSGVTARVELVQLDVTRDDQIADAVKHVETTYGRLDVLINNAGIIRVPPQDDLTAIRATYNYILDVNLTSVAVITTAFTPLLHKSPDPKVINVTSGLASLQNTLTKKMGRAPAYGASKVALNGLTVHMQTAENDRVSNCGRTSDLRAHMGRVSFAGGAKDGDDASDAIKTSKPRIRFYVCAPGVLKTAFSNYFPAGREPNDGAEVVVRLLEDDESTYEGGSQWQFEEEEMRKVPW